MKPFENMRFKIPHLYPDIYLYLWVYFSWNRLKIWDSKYHICTLTSTCICEYDLSALSSASYRQRLHIIFISDPIFELSLGIFLKMPKRGSKLLWFFCRIEAQVLIIKKLLVDCLVQFFLDNCCKGRFWNFAKWFKSKRVTLPDFPLVWLKSWWLFCLRIQLYFKQKVSWFLKEVSEIKNWVLRKFKSPKCWDLCILLLHGTRFKEINYLNIFLLFSLWITCENRVSKMKAMKYIETLESIGKLHIQPVPPQKVGDDFEVSVLAKGRS